MRRIVIALLAFAGLGLAVACGGSSTSTTEPSAQPSQSVLHLSSGDTTEAEFRTQIRAALLSAGSGDFCRSLQGLSDTDAAAAIVAAQEGMATPVQEAVQADRERAAAITKEECQRILRGS